MSILLLLRVVGFVSSVTETVAAADTDLVSFFFHLSLPFWPLQIFIFSSFVSIFSFPSYTSYRLLVIKIRLLEVLGNSLYVSTSIFCSSLRWYKTLHICNHYISVYLLSENYVCIRNTYLLFP